MNVENESAIDDSSKEVSDAGQPPEVKRRRVDPVSLVGGLVFVAVAVAVLAQKYWVEVDAVLIIGGAVIAAGVAMIAGVILRSRREREGA